MLWLTAMEPRRAVGWHSARAGAARGPLVTDHGRAPAMDAQSERIFCA